MALRLRMSHGYVRKILTKILGVYQVKKRKVHHLSEKQKAVRYERGNKFMEKYLTHRKLKLLFTMDEMMIRTSDLHGQSDFYYKGKSRGCARKYAKNTLQKLASTGYGRYGILLAWEISLVCRSGKKPK